MRFYEISRRYHEERQKFLSTATLFVLEGEWDRLRAILRQFCSAEITEVRPLCRFSGLSVDVVCQSREDALKLFGIWHDNSIDALCRDAAELEARSEGARKG
jgi:hypothetical protein